MVLWNDFEGCCNPSQIEKTPVLFRVWVLAQEDENSLGGSRNAIPSLHPRTASVFERRDYVLTSSSHDPQVQAQKPPPKTVVPSPVTICVIISLNKYLLRVCSLITSPPDDRHAGLNRRWCCFCSGRLYLLLCEAMGFSDHI